MSQQVRVSELPDFDVTEYLDDDQAKVARRVGM